jgi:hypothetical protein
VVDRLGKEAVAAAVSVANVCPYCVDMHSTGMYDLACEHDAEAIVYDRVHEVTDDRVRALAAWARVAHLPDAPVVRTPPFDDAERAELVGVAVAFHYVARMVNVFLPGYLLPPRLGLRARRRFKQGVSHVLAPVLRASRTPGRSLSLLPDAPMPSCATWAAGNVPIAAAVARAYAAFEAAGERSVHPAVRELVCGRVDGWRGEAPGPSRRWCDEFVIDLPADLRAAGRLALLTAVASYQVDDEVVHEFQRRQPDDAALVDTAAWASFAAARRVGAGHARTTEDVVYQARRHH